MSSENECLQAPWPSPMVQWANFGYFLKCHMIRVHFLRKSAHFSTKTPRYSYQTQFPHPISQTNSIFSLKKLKKIRSEFSDTTANSLDFDENVVESTLSTFRLLKEDEVRSMIKKSHNKSCSLDPIPTSLLKTCIDELTPTITTIINGSLQDGKMP